MLGRRAKISTIEDEGAMEYRQLGNSGLKVSVLTMGTMTFGGKGNFAKVGNLQLDEVRKLIDIVADAGVNLIDTANVYSGGGSGELIGGNGRQAQTRHADRDQSALSDGGGAKRSGLSRWHLIRECEASLKRLNTDVIDLYQVHQWDGLTPLEETMEALDSLVRSGKVRYVGCSNWSGWHMMKAMEVARRDGRIPFVSEQIHYTLQAREAEYELIPVALDQKLAVLVWSPIAGGLLSGKHRRNEAAPEGTRQVAGWKEPPVRDEKARQLEYRRRIGGDRRSPSRLRGADRPSVVARPAGGDVGDHRRPDRRAVPRQSCLRQREAHRRRALTPRQSEPAAAHLPVLASVLDGEGPPWTR